MKKLVIILDSILIGAALASRWVISAMLQWIPSCPFLKMGVLCPACGGTRCVHLLIHGDIWGSFQMNPYIFLSFLFAGFLMVLLHCAAIFNRGEKLLKTLARPATVIIWAVGFVLFGILRNLI